MKTKNKAQKRLNRLGRRILNYALQNLYVFEDGEIEDALDEAYHRFKHRPDCAVLMRSLLLSNLVLRPKLNAVGQIFYATL